MMFKKSNGDEDMKGKAPNEEAVIRFFMHTPRPTDDQFHEWAERNRYNVHKAEQTVYRVLSDIVNKGRSKGHHPQGVSQANVNRGVKIEAEHTPNKIIQRKITDDHNTELKKYYDSKKGLPKMEKVLEKAGFFARGFVKQSAAPNIINIDVPLFIRMLEWAKEDAQTDMQLHQATENIIGMSGKGLLTMDSYKGAVSGKDMPPLPPEMMKKGGKAKTVQELLNFLRSKGHRVYTGMGIEKKAGYAFLDELEKIAKNGMSERLGKIVGRTTKQFVTAPGRFIEGVKKGYKGKSPKSSPLPPAERSSIPGTIPSLGKKVEQIMGKSGQKPQPTFQKMKLPSTGKGTKTRETLPVISKVSRRSSSSSERPTRGGW